MQTYTHTYMYIHTYVVYIHTCTYIHTYHHDLHLDLEEEDISPVLEEKTSHFDSHQTPPLLSPHQLNYNYQHQALHIPHYLHPLILNHLLLWIQEQTVMSVIIISVYVHAKL